MQAEGWTTVPSWQDLLEGARPQHNDQAVGLGDWPHGWQFHASRIRHSHFRDRVLLPSLPPSLRALLRSQAGAQAGAWLTAIPADVSTALSPGSMQVALRRRMRLPLPIAPNRCGGEGPGCGGVADAFGDHALACPRAGLLARRAKVVERAWVRVAREAVGPEGQVVPQQWLAHTTAVGVDARDRRRLDLVIYGVSPRREALCCDATLVSPLTRSGAPQPRASEEDGAALRVAERRKRATYPELLAQGPQRLLVLGSEVSGRWNDEALGLVRDLARCRSLRAPPAVRRPAAQGWQRRWWAQLSSVAVQQAVGSTALGRAWPAAPQGACPSRRWSTCSGSPRMRARAACPCAAELLASHSPRVLVCSSRRFTCDA